MSGPKLDRSEFDRMIACVEREAAMRERVYWKWVAAGRMNHTNATYEIETMQSVLRFLQQSRAAMNVGVE